MMSSTTHVLNVSADRSGARRPPAELSLELQKTMLRLKGEFMSEDGREVRYSQLRSSEVFREYELLAGALCHCDLTDIVEDEDEMKAFFINVYNALTVHGLAIAEPLPSSVLDLDKFWPSTAYDIGGHIFSLDDMEHGVLRGNRPHPAAERPPFAEDDARRRRFALKSCDARIHFALVCGAKSCPAIQVYSSSNLDRALTAAAQSFCSQEVELDVDTRTVTTSKIFHWYASDFGSSERELLEWVCQYLPDQTRAVLEKMLESDRPITLRARDYNWQLNSDSRSVL